MARTLLGLSGSLRRASFNTALLRAAAELAPDGVTVDLATLHGIPLYDGDLEDATGVPDAVQALAARIAAADGVLVASPEYNGGMPGVLKNALDWLSRLERQPLAGKPLAIMGVTPGRLATARMQQQLRVGLVAFDPRLLNKPDVMLAGAEALFDADGRLVDAAARARVAALVAALAAA